MVTSTAIMAEIVEASWARVGRARRCLLLRLCARASNPADSLSLAPIAVGTGWRNPLGSAYRGRPMGRPERRNPAPDSA